MAQIVEDAEVPRPRRLSSLAAQPGDIIFIYAKEGRPFPARAGSWLTRLGQSLLSLLVSLRLRATRFAHVALVTEPLMAVHALPGAARADAISSILPRDWTPNVRVVRPVEPALTVEEQTRLADRASYFLRQPYRFWFGHKTHPFGRVARAVLGRGDQRTLPYCSYLVADAFASIDRQILALAPDQTLPLDLDHACVAPAWADVTDLYYEANPADLIAGFDPDTRERLVDLHPDLSARNLELGVMSAQIAEFRYDHAETASFLFREALPAMELHLSLALKAAENPAGLLNRAASEMLDEIRSLPELYDSLGRGVLGGQAGLVAGLKQEFPNLPAEAAPYEGMPSVTELERLELEHEVLGFSARVVPIQASLLACAVVVARGGQPGEDGLTLDLVLPILKELPELDSAGALRIRTVIENFTDAPGASELRALLGQMIDLHLKLSAHKAELNRVAAAWQEAQ